SPLSAGSSVTRTQEVTLPQFDSGDRWIVVRADSSNGFLERDPANNAAMSDQPVHIPATLTLMLSQSTVAENAGPNALTATVTRNGDTDDSLIVLLTSGDTNKIRLPASVVIPARRVLAQFNMGVLDNAIADGDETVLINAAAVGYAHGVSELILIDDDRPELSLQFPVSTVSEGDAMGAAIGYVSRNTPTNNA